MFDDLERNLTIPAELGMGTVLVGGSPGSGGTASEVLGHRRWRVWDLAAFLHSLTAPAVSPWTM
jgi:putative hydrolase of the HAD superfamily